MTENTREFEEETIRENEDEQKSLIFRYKFSEAFAEELYIFAKVHQYNDRKVFKENWEIWIEENAKLLDDEIIRLKSLNYEGDIMEKMFKSARYYFRNKSMNKSDPKDRGEYITLLKEFLALMDEDIMQNILNADFTPQNSFEEFCKKNKENEIFTRQFKILYEMQEIKDYKIIEKKFKKTYKNRYFILITRLNKIKNV